MRIFLALALALSAAPALAQPAVPKAGGLDPAFVTSLVGPPLGAKLEGEALEARTREVAGLVRCPVCQGSTVADSPSDTARNMKKEIHDLLAQGYEQEQILHYFELSYGEFVRLDPRTSGITWLVWAGPALGLLAGLALVAVAVRRMTRRSAAAAPAPPPGRGQLPDDPSLAAAVKRVRELAYGWPGGEPPGGA